MSTLYYHELNGAEPLSLDLMTLQPVCEGAETSDGVPLTVTAVSVCQVVPQGQLHDIALEQFFGKSSEEIKNIILLTLEGHLRAITGTPTMKEIHDSWHED